MTDEDRAQIEKNKALPNKNRKDADVPGKVILTVRFKRFKVLSYHACREFYIHSISLFVDLLTETSSSKASFS